MAVSALAILAVLVAVAMAAERPEAMLQRPEALRSFSDRHDKFNQNYASDPLDSVGQQANTKKSRTQQPLDEHADYYDNSRRQRPSLASSASSLVNQRRHYDDYRYDQYEGYEGVNRNGENAYESSSYNPNANANRKTLSLGGGGKSSNLAMVVSPLAGISFIAVAAAVAISPVYLTLSSSLFGRKRRDLMTGEPSLAGQQITPEMVQKIHELQTLEKFLASVPKEADYQQQIMSMYLSCSGYTEEGNVCLDRVFCEYGNAESKISEQERDVLSIVLYNIMSNEFVPAEYKQRLRTAARTGRDFQQCSRYDCPALSQ